MDSYLVVHLLVILNLFVLLFVIWYLRKLNEAVSVLFNILHETTRGRPVHITFDEDDNLEVRFHKDE
jgi:hypothetical protein